MPRTHGNVPKSIGVATETVLDLKPIGETQMSNEIDLTRRRLLGTGIMTIAAAEFAIVGPAQAQSNATDSGRPPTIKQGANTSFGPLKQIDAGVLNVGFVDAGPADGPVAILLHGW